MTVVLPRYRGVTFRPPMFAAVSEPLGRVTTAPFLCSPRVLFGCLVWRYIHYRGIVSYVNMHHRGIVWFGEIFTIVGLIATSICTTVGLLRRYAPP